MPPPAYTDWIYYSIWFSDPDEYAFAVAAAGGDLTTGGVFHGMSPDTAAGLFGIPIPYPSGNMDLIDKTITFPEYLQSCGPTQAGVKYSTVGTICIAYNDDVGIIVPPVNIPFLGQVGQTFLLQWAGQVLFKGRQAPTTPTPTFIPQRRFIGGWELENNMEGGAGSTGVGCRDASRTMDGLGMACRGQNTPGTTWTRQINEYTGVSVRKSWERIYFRPRVVGTGIVGFWRCQNSTSPGAGAALVYNTAGGVDLYTINSLSTPTLQQSGFVPDSDWTKFDIYLIFPSAGPEEGRIVVAANGVVIYDFHDTSGGSMDTVGFHQQSQVGKGVGIGALGTADAQVEFDLDDWINGDIPGPGGIVIFPDSLSDIMGSHVRKVWNLSGSAPSYTPAGSPFQITNQGNNPQQKLNSALVSSTSGAQIDLTTDLPPLGIQDKATGIAWGIVAFILGEQGTNSGSTDGSLGFSVAGAGYVMTVINETAAGAFNSVLYNPFNLIVPAEVTPLLLRYIKSADANTATVNAIQGVAEELGVWGHEDVVNDLVPADFPRINNLHNCNYPETQFATPGPPPIQNVFMVGGTYTGNGTQQDILLPDACHMLFIRNNAGGSNGVKWFACGLGGHLGTTDRVVPNMPVRVWFDPVAQSYKFTVAGTDVNVNTAAATYQYIAFCDPGMRYCVGGAYNVPSNVSSRAHVLQNDNFTPAWAFVQSEILGNASSSEGLAVKGPGNTGNVGNRLLSATVLNNFGSFSSQTLTTGADNHPSTLSQCNFLVFRASEPGCGWVSTQIFSYTGDGNASRVIPMTPATGRFPLFVLVCPTSGAQSAIFRDPSHAGVNSATFTGLVNTTTGITAGATDSITVGISLNANGVIYNVFAIPGDFTGWNNGTFFPPNCNQPEAWYDPPMDPPEIAVFGNGGLDLDGVIPITLLKDVTGIYTLQPGKTNDTMYDRQTGQPSVNMKIPDPQAKTGYIGG